MFEIMMNCIEMAKEEVVWILVFMQTGMGHNYVFENTSEMAAFGRAWLDTQSMVDAFCNGSSRVHNSTKGQRKEPQSARNGGFTDEKEI